MESWWMTYKSCGKHEYLEDCKGKGGLEEAADFVQVIGKRR